MILVIMLAIANGSIIALSRTVNGALGRRVGAMRSSFWNHAVGFGFMSLVVPVIGLFSGALTLPHDVPFIAWLGGVLGVIFVAINSHVIVRLGASRTTCFVVGAQMLTGVALSSLSHALDERLLPRIIGATLVIGGIVLGNTTRRRPAVPSERSAAPEAI